MIKKITLENFFSFKEKTTIELNPNINILVGINGSGKSNFIKAIKLLYESVIGNGFEKIFLKDWGGFNSIANFNNSQTDFIRISYEFDKKILDNDKKISNPQNLIYEITIHKSGGTAYYLEEKAYFFVEKEEVIIFYMKNGNGFLIDDLEKKYEQNIQYNNIFNNNELVLYQISDPNKFYSIYIIKRAIEDFIVYDYFDTTLKSKIRQPNTFGTETKLLSNGENLAQILNLLKNRHSLYYEKIQKLIQKINPNFVDTSFDFLGSLLYLVLREKELSRAVGAQHISDGTLRYLLLLTIFLNPENGNLLCIDEPEIGLHPDMTNTIAEAIKDTTHNGSQIIIATHSPLLLNSFELDEILIFEKNENNSSIVLKKTEKDFEDWDEDFLSGQMWLRGQLGGKRW